MNPAGAPDIQPKRMSSTNLFSAGRIDGFATPNRIVMAPMTRSRASNEVPSELAIEYYSQRATAGLIISEGTAPSAMGIGYARTPGIYTAEQIAAWKKITDGVHAKGGRIFLQIMHVGRIAHSANRSIPDAPVAPSAIRAAGKMWTDTQMMQDNDLPRALETAEIPGVIAEYAQATRNALEAGFDGVELHAASGYLPMQFLSTGSNHRTDQYGGSVENRIRFVVETLQAMSAAAGGASKVGIKLSPGMAFNDIQDDNPVETYTELVKAISPLGLAYLHVMRSAEPANILGLLRPLFNGPFIAGGGFDLASGNEILREGGAEFVAYGRFYISNPDLVARFENGAALAEADASTFYMPGPAGYIDYPAL